MVDNIQIFNVMFDLFPSGADIKYVNARNTKAKDIVTSLSQKNTLNKFELFIVGKIKIIKISVKDMNPKLRMIPSKTLL